MKKNVIIKVLALTLTVCMLTAILASCSLDTYFIKGSTAVMSMEGTKKDSNEKFTVEITANELSYYLTQTKIEVLAYYAYTGLWQEEDGKYVKTEVGRNKENALWAYEMTGDDGKSVTMNESYTASVVDNCRQILIEKYLFEYYGLEFTEEQIKALEQEKISIESNVKMAGGKGAYKQYFGYTTDTALQAYTNDLIRLRVFDYFYNDDDALFPITDEQKLDYYKENYGNTQFIFVDYTANKQYFESEEYEINSPIFVDSNKKNVVLDKDGKQVLLATTTTYYEITVEYYDEFGNKVENPTEEQKKTLTKKEIVSETPFDTTKEENKNVDVSDTSKFKKVVDYKVSLTYKDKLGNVINSIEGLGEDEYTVEITYSDADITGFVTEKISTDDTTAASEKTLLAEKLYEDFKNLFGADKDKTPAEEEEEKDDSTETTTAAQTDTVITIEDLILNNTDNYTSYKYADGYLFKYTDGDGNDVNPFSEANVLNTFKDLKAGEYAYFEVEKKGAYIVYKTELPEKPYENSYITAENLQKLEEENEKREEANKTAKEEDKKIIFDLEGFIVDDYFADIFSSSVNTAATEQDDVFANGFDDYVKSTEFVDYREEMLEKADKDGTYQKGSKLDKFTVKKTGLPKYYDRYLEYLIQSNSSSGSSSTTTTK